MRDFAKKTGWEALEKHVRKPGEAEAGGEAEARGEAEAGGGAEAGGERRLLVGAEVLVREQEPGVLEERLLDRSPAVVVERGQPDAGDDGPERGVDSIDLHLGKCG